MLFLRPAITCDGEIDDTQDTAKKSDTALALDVKYHPAMRRTM